MPYRRTSILILAIVVVLAAAIGTGTYVDYLNDRRSEVAQRLDVVCSRQSDALAVAAASARRIGDNDAADAFRRILQRPCEKKD